MATVALTLKNVRKGDTVKFYARGHYARIIGVVTKVNAKSFKMVQTNDETYVAKPSFGNYKYNRKGGEGYEWSISQNKGGIWNQVPEFTNETMVKAKETGRFGADLEAVRVKDLETATYFLKSYLKRAVKVGATSEEVQALVEAAFATEEN